MKKNNPENRKRLIVGNWKAYVTQRKDVGDYFRAFARAYADVKTSVVIEVRTSSGRNTADSRRTTQTIEVVFCPSFPFLSEAASSVRALGMGLGAQDVFWEAKGPHTGEVTPLMLKSLGISYVIIGHSERRRRFGETDETAHKKILASLAEGLMPVICVGEWEKAHGEDAERVAYDFVRMQVRSALAGIAPKDFKHIVFAYEPVWAITGSGTGEADTPENAARMIVFIRRIIATLSDAKTAHAMRIIYGGSVTSQNVAGYVRQEPIDGVLPGSASANPKEFAKIISEARNAKKH